MLKQKSTTSILNQTLNFDLLIPDHKHFHSNAKKKHSIQIGRIIRPLADLALKFSPSSSLFEKLKNRDTKARGSERETTHKFYKTVGNNIQTLFVN